jgi:hypothetical protein
MQLQIKYFGMRSSLLKVFGLLKTERGLEWFEQKHLTDDTNIIFLNVEGISHLMNERYNYLKKISSTAHSSKRYGQVSIIKKQ